MTIIFKYFVLPLIFAFCSSAQAQTLSELDAPLPLTDQQALGLTHLSLRPESARILAEGQSQAALRFDWSNTVNSEKGAFLVDAETRVLNFEFRHGLSTNWQATLRQPVTYRGGGVTDDAIDGWHQFFGLPRGPRKRLPDDTYEIFGETNDLGEFRLDRDGTAFGPTELSLTRALVSDSQIQISLVGTAGLPIGAAQYAHNGTDLGLTLLSRISLGEFSLTSGQMFLYYPDDSLNNLRYRKARGAAFFGLGYQAWEKVGLFLTLSALTDLIDNVPKYPSYQTYLDFGGRWRFAEKTTLELAFREDPGPEDSTADFTAHIGLLQDF